ncbi:uncharacterized protein LOC131322295 [Rhododendron vialii]|uniref:uncharacterized protein LOC131322295 n=1 Tax=Rhododendron vialii TaxID=182163 RepID=UPI00265F2FEE|nr:uncharacterized protein LOC131322295 [Rhododendron vialii]
MVRTNLGTSVYLHFKKDMNGITTYKFERMYICWIALKKGFIEGCRPIIGVDGCHLKGPHCGQLLATVAIYGNNQIYPMAYTMVEVEDEASWSWFLEHLKNDLEIPNEPTFTIISNKQKCLINAINNLLPCVEHRHCVRLLHSNMKRAGYTGQAVKDRLWSLARATYMGRFKSLMEEFKKEDEGSIQVAC